jgi:hypothetical protein
VQPRSAILARLRWLPPALLLVLGANQIFLAKTQHLSPWLGGGFGMFASTEDRRHRHLHLIEERPGVVRELRIPESLHDRVRRALAHPTDWRLREVAREVAAASKLRSSAALRLELWQTRYAPRTLAPSSDVLRTLVFAPGELP